MAESKQVANSKTNARAMYEGFENYGGEGFSDVTTEDLAIPFLRILESMSPQVNERDGAYVKNAKAGMIYNNVLNEYLATTIEDLLSGFQEKKVVDILDRMNQLILSCKQQQRMKKVKMFFQVVILLLILLSSLFCFYIQRWGHNVL